MPTSTRFAVAVHALTALVANEGHPVPSEQIAGSVNTNATVVRRILASLANAGLTTSQLGLGGGALLARRATDITLLDVYLAVEDPNVIATHRSTPDATCVVGRHILEVLTPHIGRAERALQAELARVTLADIAGEVAWRSKVKFPLTH
jgi:Rrf2 family protein